MTVLQNCTAQNYGTGIIPQILSGVDQTGCTYVQGAFQELARDVTAGGAGASIASLLLIAYVILWGFGIWSGTATGTATDAAFRLFRAFVIYTLATSWSDFTSFAYTLFNDGPAAIGNRLLSVGNNNTYTSPNAVVSALEAIWNQVAQGFQLHFAFSLQSFASALVGMACVIVIALFLAVATFTIILSKVFLWLILGIATSDDPAASVQRLVALLLRLARRRRDVCDAPGARLFLPRLLSHRHAADFCEPWRRHQQWPGRLGALRHSFSSASPASSC